MPHTGEILGQKVEKGGLEQWNEKEHQCGVGAGEVQERKGVALTQEEWSTWSRIFTGT